MKLYKRLAADQIVKYLHTDEIIVLHGARQVGKTYILYYLEKYLKDRKAVTFYIDLEDSRFVQILDRGVTDFLKLLREEGLDPTQKVFVFIDEIQYLKNPSSFLKLVADHHKNIKLIVSGSSSFEIKSKFKDSLVGRTVNFEIFNLCFEEFLTFKEYNFNKKQIHTAKKVDELKSLWKEYALYGGYPKIVLTPGIAIKEKRLQQIIDTYLKKDIRDLANVRDLDKFNKLVEILASQSGNLLNVMELANTSRLAKQTVGNYLFLLENTYIIKLVKPYSRNLRSELFKVPKIFFYDSGLMQMLWLKTLQKQLIGNVFETAVFAELIKKHSKDNVLYWRTTDQKEIDFIVRDKSRILPIEAKLNFQNFHAASIKYFCKNYNLKNYKVIGLEGEPNSKNFSYPWSLA